MRPFAKPKSQLGADRKPNSVSTSWINWCAALSLFAVLFALKYFEVDDASLSTLAVIASISLPIIVLEWLFTDKYLIGDSACSDDFQAKLIRCSFKVIGIAGSWLFLLLVYWMFPYFRGNAQAVYDFFSNIWMPLIFIAPFYIWFVDSRMKNPRDEFYYAGLFFTCQFSWADKRELYSYLRACLVKIFFYQYILVLMPSYTSAFINYDFGKALFEIEFGFMDVFIDAMYMLDVAFACAGYVLTLRLFDTHVRSTDSTLLGWGSCLLCYGAFYVMLSGNFIAFDDGYFWGHWLAPYPVLRALWAIPIIVCLALYAAGTVQFGLRFSNLSHRGIITNGVFSLTKHPNYVFKNISWWLISIPFISSDGAETAIRNCLMLACFTFIYYLRAKTEEQHLSADPIYREYAAWIEQHGMIARAKRTAVALIQRPLSISQLRYRKATPKAQLVAR